MPCDCLNDWVQPVRATVAARTKARMLGAWMEGDESQGGPLSSRTQPEATEPMHYVFDVAEDYPDWGLRRGDVVTVTFGGDAAPVELRRELPPNFGGVLALLEGGVLR